ncbi:transglycosylase domain-containing protein [Paenibacillus ginsengarvi]|uniref:PBP1A family penicillin-binding protein n=1 Tax=Paenibacillus ginsengarvi TaxID=400777 RepID=A0A3B0CL91_9BACL|nr:PBP1A family penicillin-binding protein [Paenibacillus ginsengarvi]RKN85730.1 PBP1A family penicillin-binding protein [Paenibacillus ginsengarvi]
MNKNGAHPGRESGGRRSKSGRPRKSWLRRIVTFLLSCGLIGVAGLIVLTLYLRTQALPVGTFSQPSQMYDIHGDLIASFQSGQNREFVPLRDIPQYLIEATLAIEDKRFYDHVGVDLRGIARAAVVNVQQGSRVQGASTLTQQLARNLYLTQDRTWSRKIKEAVYAVQLEMQLSKDQIMEKYLNEATYYGNSAYGVQAAAKLFFGKDVSELTLAESAMIAGVPKGPRYYSPYFDMDNALARQQLILTEMANQGYITQQEADAAKREKLDIRPPEKKSLVVQAPYFRDYVRQVAITQLGIEEREFDEGGIRIYTTLDLSMQQAAEDAVAAQLEGAGELQASLVAIDPRNGYVKAMVGGKDYGDNQFNRAISDSRQPGSAFKAFVYLTALQQPGFTAVTKFKSEPTVFPYDGGRKTYTPSNFGGKYPNDYIDMREAIAKSDNIFAVQTMLQVGADKVIETARKMGVTSRLEPLPSLALGTYPVSPLEMAGAFGIIANQGVRIDTSVITRIESATGKLLYEAKPVKSKVVEPEYAYTLTSLMKSVFDTGGTASRVASLIKRPVAGKTGTTNTDAWMVGFTPELSAAVWVGYDRDRVIDSAESYKAAPIFASFIERALEAVPPKLFPVPEQVTSVYIDPATGKLATDKCPGARIETFVKGTEPTEYCSEHGAAPADQKEAPKKSGSWWNDLKRWWND